MFFIQIRFYLISSCSASFSLSSQNFKGYLFSLSCLAKARYSSPFILSHIECLRGLIPRVGSRHLFLLLSNLRSNSRYCSAQGDFCLRMRPVCTLCLLVISAIVFGITDYKVSSIDYFTMNKIDNHRYSRSPPYTPRSIHKYRVKTEEEARHCHALSRLIQKQTEIETVKKRISALCLREQRYTHRTLNTEMILQKKQAVKKEIERIQNLLHKQRQKQLDHLDILKYKNIQARAGNYFRMRIVKEKREEDAQEVAKTIRNRSKEYHHVITEQKIANIESKKQRSKDIYSKSLQSKQVRNRLLQEKKEEVQSREIKEAEHFSKLEEIKNNQLHQLSQLELMMMEKSNISRAAYQTTRNRLQRETKHQTDRALKTSREYNPETIHLNMY